MQDDREGLFDTINRNKTHYQKRAYQVIKALTHLFSTCPVAGQILLSNEDIRRKWTESVSWLHEELERRPYAPNNQYIYNEWTTPSQSNETSNGYYLERSHSARMTLAKACELCPDEERIEDQPGPVDGDQDKLGRFYAERSQSTRMTMAQALDVEEGRPGTVGQVGEGGQQEEPENMSEDTDSPPPEGSAQNADKNGTKWQPDYTI